MLGARSLTGCRVAAVGCVLTVFLAGGSGCSGSSSSNASGTGGRGTGTGGVPAGTGGRGTGGVTSGTGGALVGSGGRGTGGVPAGTGGTPVGTGGRGSGGVLAGTGGVLAGTGGGSAGDAAVPIELSGHDVKVDPYGTSPLVAVVNLRGIEASKVQRLQVVVTGQDSGPDFVKTYSPTDDDLVLNMDTSDLTFAEAGYHVPVLGLYADRESVVRILVDVLDRGRVDLTLKINASLATSDEAAWVPSIRVKTAEVAQMEPGWTVAEISIEPNPNPPIVFAEWTRSIAFDERGAIRWALRLDDLPKGETFTVKRSLRGNFWSGSLDTIVEVSKLGRILRTFQLSGYTLNHEIVQIGGEDDGEGVPSGTKSEHFGNLLVLGSKDGESTIQDHILELDSDTGKLLNVWDLTKVFDPTRRTYIDAEGWDISQNGDWFHDNGLAYSQADESIVVSGRHQGVAKIRRDGALVWLLAPHKGWNQPQSDKLLTAVNASQEPYAESVQLGNEAAGTAATPEFDWPFGQHSPNLLPNGDLLLFDNGASRHFKGNCGSFSRAVSYRIDEAAMTVRQIGQLILSKTESACYCSNTYRLPGTGNVFVQPGFTRGNIVVAKEVTTRIADDGTIAFDKVVFDATLDMSIVDTSRWYVYSSRGHRWAF